MKILFVDLDGHNYSHLNRGCIDVHTEHTKYDAIQYIQTNDVEAVFINIKFNNDFVETLKSIQPRLKIYLFNNQDDLTGLTEHVTLIDGYYKLPSQRQFEKTINKIANYSKIYVR